MVPSAMRGFGTFENRPALHLQNHPRRGIRARTFPCHSFVTGHVTGPKTRLREVQVANRENSGYDFGTPRR